MLEKIPENNENKTVEELTELVRESIISDLEDYIKDSRKSIEKHKEYTEVIINTDKQIKRANEIINKLRNREPVEIGGPFWGDFLDSALGDLGIRKKEGGKYETVWNNLEKGA